MDIAIITAVTVIVFGAFGLILVTGWIIGTWRQEVRRNRDRAKEKPPRTGTTHVSIAGETESPQRGAPGYGR